MSGDVTSKKNYVALGKRGEILISKNNLKHKYLELYIFKNQSVGFEHAGKLMLGYERA